MARVDKAELKHCSRVYLERQWPLRQCCAIHAVNNILQQQPENPSYFNKAEADGIAAALWFEDQGLSSWCRLAALMPCSNPYRSCFTCAGDYDISVIAQAL